MKVKPVDPAAVIRDPHTKQALPAEGADVPDNAYWHRRLIAGEIVRGDEAAPPIGNEPIAPLTTRGGK
jgi:hypothetical protein